MCNYNSVKVGEISENTKILYSRIQKALSRDLINFIQISTPEEALRNHTGDDAQAKILKQISSATTALEGEKACSNTLTGSELEKIAFAHWLSLCKTIKEALVAYYYASTDSECQMAVIQKIYDLWDGEK